MLKAYQRLNNLLSLDTVKDRDNAKDSKQSLISNINIPLDPQEFYTDFGYLLHPKTGEPVPELTPYQYDIWNDKTKYRLVVKSQKVGLSISALLEDFQKALTTCKGKDILIIAQSQAHANEHLRTLKNLILNSEKYRHFLITKPSELSLAEEKTKVGVAYIKNPNNQLQPGTIIALGSSETQIWSWKQVGHIHFSDITASKLVNDESLFAAAFSRLANTDGTMLIETPPRRPKGKVFELYEKYHKHSSTTKGLSNDNDLDLQQTPENNVNIISNVSNETFNSGTVPQISKDSNELFKVYIVKAQQAVNAGLITKEFLDAERERLGPLYSQFYEAEFLSIGGNVLPNDYIDYALDLGEKYKDLPINNYALHFVGVDFGFSSSVTSICICELDTENQIVRVIREQTYDKKTPSFIADILFKLHTEIRFCSFFLDGANRGAVNECKSKFGESLEWDKAEDINPDDNHILPVNFTKYHKSMLEHTYHLLVKHKLAIPKQYSRLETALRTAWATNGWDLDKDQTLEDDSIDALRLALKGVIFKTNN
ncbi:MAG: hypothetical protein MRJ93_00305 [Nitrososphaeraceae archaeon]|nr:hypothetical protein [Nitrososphaeraceae archaeon]